MRLIFTFLLSLTMCGVQAQQGQQNLETYKYLRKRLVNDFMLVGEGQGKSIVAERRNGSDYPGRLIFHADETSNMGIYLAMLATEYKLLSDNGRPVESTLQELGYALKAINRLDETAESYLRNPQNPSSPQAGDLNGFFIRSDVSHAFFTSNSNHFNSGEFSTAQISAITSSFYDPTLQFPQPLRESQDQVLNLMMGLGFISKYVDDSLAGFTFQDGENNFSQEAKNITSRMVSYLKQNNWKIKDPVSGQILTNLQGGDANYLSYGFAEAACAILNEFSATGSGFPETSCSMYHDITTTTYYPLFQYSNTYLDCPQGYSTTSTDCRSCHELYKPMLLAAIGNCYYQSGSNVTSTVLSQQGLNAEIQIIPLIHKILWQTNSHSINDTIYTKILDHDLTKGPYNNGNCDYPDFEWSAPVRWRQPERRGAGCEVEEQDTACFNFFSGEYNGLDYMLLFNLYSLSNPSFVSYDLGDPLTTSFSNAPSTSIYTDNNNINIASESMVRIAELYSLTGNIVLKEDNINKHHFSLTSSGLTSGVYLIRLTTIDQQQIIRKLFLP